MLRCNKPFLKIVSVFGRGLGALSGDHSCVLILSAAGVLRIVAPPYLYYLRLGAE
jgi:hypothetical protein